MMNSYMKRRYRSLVYSGAVAEYLMKRVNREDITSRSDVKEYLKDDYNFYNTTQFAYTR